MQKSRLKYTIMTMVEAGRGFSVLAGLIQRRTNYDIGIRSTDPPVFRTVGLAYINRDSLPSASKKIIQHIKQNRSELP